MTEDYKIKSAKDIKIPSSGTRLLELLKALVKGPLSSGELLKVVEEYSDNIYRPEVVNKYLNTLKLLGFEIVKRNGKYHLLKGIDRVDYSEMDLSLLKFLQKYSLELSMPMFAENLNEAIQFVERTFSSSTQKFIQENKVPVYLPKIRTKKENKEASQYEKYCKDGLKLNIIYALNKGEEENYKVIPLKVVHKNGKTILVAYDSQNCVYKEFVLECIKEVVQLPQKQSGSYSMSVTFKLKNRLAKSYLLKSGERVIELGKDFIVVSNQNEDRDFLIRRLARYFDQCEVLYPKEFRQKMVDFIEATEKLYE